MTVAFVVINTEPGKENDVYSALQHVPEVAELHPLSGEFDLIAKLETSSFDSLGELIVSRVRSIPGVLNTKTFTGTRW